MSIAAHVQAEVAIASTWSTPLDLDGLLAILGGGYETPEQIADLTSGGRWVAGLDMERRLCLAMIELAIRDLAGNKARRLGYGASALAWVRADYDSSLCPDVRTFEGCCSTLGLASGPLREALVRLLPREGRARRMNHNACSGRGRKRKARIVPREQAAA